LDPNGDLPQAFCILKEHGVVVRTTAEQLQADIALKLRIANGTHTAISHLMALLKLTMTDSLSASDDTAKLLMLSLDSLFEKQIWAAGTPGGLPPQSPEAKAVYDDWRQRLTHPHFGLSTFFITQNGAAKGGIRLGPTVLDLVHLKQPISVAMAFAFAALLRWLTPKEAGGAKDGKYKGWLQGMAGRKRKLSDSTAEYADGLSYNLEHGWYEFRCACQVSVGDNAPKPLSEWLAEFGEPQQPSAYHDAIRAYLLASDGGNLGAIAQKPELETLVQAVTTLYARMVAGDDMLTLLKEMKDCKGPYKEGMAANCAVLIDSPSLEKGQPLHYRVSPIPDDSKLMKLPVTNTCIESVAVSEVASVVAIDLHTHLLPPSHGPLCLWGIDELLTYVSIIVALLVCFGKRTNSHSQSGAFPLDCSIILSLSIS